MTLLLSALPTHSLMRQLTFFSEQASSSLLALILSPRWRPIPCLHGNSEPQSPWIGSSQDPQEAGAPGLLVPWESRPARPGAYSGESPPTLSFLQGNPRPLGLPLREGSSRPSTPAEGRNPRPSWRLGASPAPRSEQLTPSARACWRRAVERGEAAAAGAPRAPGPIGRRSGSRLPPQPANPCGAAAPRRRSGGTGVAGAAVATRAPPGGAWVWTRQERFEPPSTHEQVKRAGAAAAATGVGWGLRVGSRGSGAG